jgi:SAM-dependent methyltransferase
MSHIDWYSHVRPLRRFSLLRSGAYLAYEIQRAIIDSPVRDQRTIEREYRKMSDPYGCVTEVSNRCYERQLAALDSVRNNQKFKRVLEIGCSEGAFTELLEPRCETLVAIDVSPIALNRAVARRPWRQDVTFEQLDLRRDPIHDTFDLIVASGVLEYFHRPTVMWAVRNKLVGALEPCGYLLVDTTRANPVVENAWWNKVMLRGLNINEFIGQHSAMEIVSADSTEICFQSLFRKEHRA